MSEFTTKALVILAWGRVQRVGFRRFAERLAFSSKISGYIENRRDGSVRIFAQGEAQRLDDFVEAIRNAPHPIVVVELETKNARVSPRIKHFQIKVGSMAMEMLEGFGSMATQFEGYGE